MSSKQSEQLDKWRRDIDEASELLILAAASAEQDGHPIGKDYVAAARRLKRMHAELDEAYLDAITAEARCA